MDDKQRILKKGYFWTGLASIAAGASSVLLLMVIRRVGGIDVGASFSIAVATANLLINIGHLNIYGYQVSDINEEYSFSDYFKLRLCSCLMMIVIAILFSVIRGYELEKGIMIVGYCLYRAFFAFFDLFQGRYQQRNRVDLSSQFAFFRITIPDFVLALTFILLRNFSLSIIVTIISLCVFSLIYVKINEPLFFELEYNNNCRFLGLLKKGFPVFYWAFTNAFILNSSKFAVDYYMNDKARLYYAILILPATTIHMIIGFVYRPLLTDLAILWDLKKVKDLNRRITNVVLLALLITLLILLLAKPVLIPLLMFLYDVQDLGAYLYSFIVLLIAGAFQAVNTLFAYLITIIRAQRNFMWIYTISMGMALFVPAVLVKKFLFNGATVSYLILSLLQMLLLIVTFYESERKAINNCE